jgi:integrative and conjugative element protein (TIGR02256 family)
LKITISRDALVKILVEAQASIDGTETGGILAGFESSEALRVAVAGGPGPKAVRRPDLFIRDLEEADRLLQQAYDESGAVWIGDWHTHTLASGWPSSTDRASYQRLLADRELDFRIFLALIVTSRSGSFVDAEISAWLASGRRAYRGELSLL